VVLNFEKKNSSKLQFRSFFVKQYRYCFKISLQEKNYFKTSKNKRYLHGFKNIAYKTLVLPNTAQKSQF